MSRSRLLAACAALAVGTLLLVGCTSETPQPAVTATPTPVATGDGVLTIGAVFPATGSASYLGPAQAVAVDAAVKDINAAGGVLGKPVVVVHENSGDVSTGTMETSVAALIAKHADVIIGPSSSVLAERVLPKTTAASIAMISPAATSVRLTNLGKGGWFFRTIPSAADQGRVLARTIHGGKGKVAIVYLDDQNGAAVHASLVAGLQQSGGTLVADQPFAASTTNFATIISAVKTAAPDAVVFVSPFSMMTQNKSVITGLTAAGLGGAKLWLTSENMADYSQALPANAVLGVNGLLEGLAATPAFTAKLKALNPTISTLQFAPEAYDATVLAALAATLAHSDSGSAIADNLRAASSGGIKCTTYAECLSALKTTNDIDYDGLTGDIAFDSSGDPEPAHYGVYRYDANGRFARVGSAVG